MGQEGKERNSRREETWGRNTKLILVVVMIVSFIWLSLCLLMWLR